LNPRARPLNAGDGHLTLVVFVLNGIKSESARTQWVQKWLPKTASYMGLLDQSSRVR
jgi:hypothetical protein